MTRSVLVLLVLVGGLALTSCGSGAKPTAHYTTSPPTTITGVGVTTSRPPPGGPLQPGVALDHRIGPVSFGEPKPQVTKALGRGVAARLDGHRIRFYPRVGIYVAYPPNPPKGVQTIAAFIVTRSAHYKTRSGVGVGPSLRDLRRHVRVRCYNGPPSAPSECQHEKANIKLPFTVFNIDPTTKRVTEVAIVPGGD
jgi:hypothetical protein